MAAGTPKKQTTLERIRRLERVELDRLERRERQKQARDEKLASAAEAAQVPGSAVERFERRAKIPMIVIGVVWLVVFVIALNGNVSSNTESVLVGILFVTWAIALIEYVIRLVLAPDPRRYIGARKAEPAVVVLPALQCVRIVGLDKFSLVVGEIFFRIKAILLHRGLFRVLLAAAGLVFLGAWLVMLAEKNEVGSNIHGYGDAVWWAIVTTTTVGYGDRFPMSALGRVVAASLMLIGIGLIGVLTATVASFFVREHSDENKAQLERAHEDLGGRLSDLDERLARLETLLEQAVGNAATSDDQTRSSQ